MVANNTYNTMSKVETVRVKHPDGFMWINKSDYDPKVHTLIQNKEPKADADNQASPPKGGKP